jgi:plastocyanin
MVYGRHSPCSKSTDMRTNFILSFITIGCALVASGCGGGSTSPASPSLLSVPSISGTTGARLHTVDDPPPPADNTPPPAPMQVIINIVGSIGSNAFMPNPTTANVGDQVVFTNGDTVLHHIVLDDGTDLGDVPPGQSSTAVALQTPTATFHCTLHPTMVGAINGAIPAPEPYMPPPDDYYGYY